MASRTGVKLFIERSAWYRVSAADLQSHGFDTSSNRDYWHMYRDGVQMPIRVNSDGSVEFFGSGKDTIYSGSAVYFLVIGDDPGMRINVTADQGASSGAAETFLLRVTERPRTVYLSGFVNGENENWFGPVVTPTEDTAMPILLTDVAPSGSNSVARVSVKLQGYFGSSHVVNVRFNNFTVGTVSFADRQNQEFEFTIPASEVVSGVNNFYLRSIGSSFDYSLIDEVSVTYERRLVASDQKIRFGVSAGDSARIGGFSGSNIKVYEVYPQNVRNEVDVDSEIVNGTHGFSLSAENRNREFVAIAETQAESVARIEANTPSSWHSLSNSADFLIVAPKAFKASADDLAAMRNAQGLQSRVVLVEDIGDEFGYGIATPDALRTFFLHASGNWSGNPGYVMLFGDSSYDYRNYLGLSQPRNFVPTKMIETFDMETSSDGWLVDFNDDGIEDLSLGRFPVASASEAANAVAKLARYDAYSGNTDQTAGLVADTFFEILNGELENLLPNDVSSTRIERSVVGDSAMGQQIRDVANTGPTMVSYLGHGSTIGWTSANVFSSNHATQLTNEKLSFYMLMTCLNGYMSDTHADSFAERLVKAPNAAIAAWASSGSTYASGQISMSQNVVSRVFSNNQRIGDIVRIAKQTSGDMDARRTWMLFGDPTVQIY